MVEDLCCLFSGLVHLYHATVTVLAETTSSNQCVPQMAKCSIIHVLQDVQKVS